MDRVKQINRTIVFVVLAFSAANLSSQGSNTLSLVFAGDIMGHDTQIESAKAMGGDTVYNYESCFHYIKPYIKEADIAIGNLEVTFAGPPYKGYPAFSSPDALADELIASGFDILVKANNHALDRKGPGLERTSALLDSIGMIQTGVFRSSEERRLKYPLIVEKNNIRLALLNATYGTNGIKVSPPHIVNYIDTIQLKEDLKKAKTAEPDFVIALMHWGSEYQLKENEMQQRTAKWLFDNGTDAIIGSHPHVVQPIKVYPGNKLAVFSMGNMISNQRKRYTDGGILVKLELKKSDSTRMVNHEYLPIWVHKAKTDNGTAFQLIPAASDSVHYATFGLTTEDIKAMKLFLEDTRDNLPDTKESIIPEFQ